MDRASSIALHLSRSTAAEQRGLISVAVVLLFLLQCVMLLYQLRGGGLQAAGSSAGANNPRGGEAFPQGTSSTPLLDNERAFWSHRMQLLNLELSYLQQRMEAVAGEVGSALKHLQIAAVPDLASAAVTGMGAPEL